MSKFLDYEGTKNAIIYNTSDWHVGSKAFSEDSALRLLESAVEEDAWITFGGDALEGKPTKSKHFDPNSLVDGLMTIEDQMHYFIDLVEPYKNHFLMLQMGNHELYLMPDYNVTAAICEGMGRPDIYGDYQTWVKYGDITMHFWHGRPTMPRGAKDPIQREANQKAWLKNKFQDLAGSADAHYMGHTHQCMIVEPLRKCALLNSGDNVKRHYFHEEKTEVDGMPYIHPDGRWYVNTGTLRRGGGFDTIDYSEVAGYAPPALAYTRTEIKNGRIVDIKKIEL